MTNKKLLSIVLICILTLSISGLLVKPVQASATPDIAGIRESWALKSDGTVWTWGSNKQAPFQTMTDKVITAMAIGNEHRLFLMPDGTVWAVGLNGFGQLGNGNTSTNGSNQVKNLSDVIAISVGANHSLALKSDGTVWSWGHNFYGQLGDGTSGTGTHKTTPVQVKNLTNAIAIAGGYSTHSLALKSDGTVRAWGNNVYGQLRVSELSNVIAIACGTNYSLALKSDGTVWACGYNFYGQLGDGTTEKRTTPVQVNNLTDVIAIAGGYSHSLALKSDGTVWAWGHNDCGQLGDGTTENRTTPVQVNNLTDVIAIAGGNGHSLALKSDGTVWAWGKNERYQLGDGTTENKNIPVQVLGPNGEGYLNLLGDNPTSLIINSPQSNTAYSEVSGHDIITVSGTVTGIDNCTVTATLTQIVEEGEPFTLSKDIIASDGEFLIIFDVLEENIPEGRYQINVIAE